MKITFTTKEESNEKRANDFLNLKPVERFYKFLELMYVVNKYPTKKENNNNNFVIEIKTK